MVQILAKSLGEPFIKLLNRFPAQSALTFVLIGGSTLKRV